MDSFEDCRDGCDDCTAIRYDYNTGDCHIYRQESCVTQKSVNYIKRDCGETNGRNMNISWEIVIDLNSIPIVSFGMKQLRDKFWKKVRNLSNKFISKYVKFNINLSTGFSWVAAEAYIYLVWICNAISIPLCLHVCLWENKPGINRHGAL